MKTVTSYLLSLLPLKHLRIS